LNLFVVPEVAFENVSPLDVPDDEAHRLLPSFCAIGIVLTCL
jgi:hypothetical protein